MLYFFIFLLIWSNIPKKWKETVENLLKIGGRKNTLWLDLDKFCTDWRGNILLDEFDDPIAIPDDAPFPPSFSKKKKEVAVFYFDSNGKMYVVTHKVHLS